MVLLQKVKRAVDGGGRDAAVARLHVALQIVGLGLAAAAQQQLQHFGALGRELRAACRAMLSGGGQPLLHGSLGSTGGRGRR